MVYEGLSRVPLNVPTMAEVSSTRPRAQPKGASRLEVEHVEKKLALVDERTFKKDIWDRDHSRCRCCGRNVIHTMSRVPNRGEVHHIHGRGKDLRFEVRGALLVCLVCHQRLTGKVNDKLVVVATKTFYVRGEQYTDARHPVKFEKVA